MLPHCAGGCGGGSALPTGSEAYAALLDYFPCIPALPCGSLTAVREPKCCPCCARCARRSVGSASTWSLERISALAEECTVTLYAKLHVSGGWCMFCPFCMRTVAHFFCAAVAAGVARTGSHAARNSAANRTLHLRIVPSCSDNLIVLLAIMLECRRT